jgi:hypothetical protein
MSSYPSPGSPTPIIVSVPEGNWLLTVLPTLSYRLWYIHPDGRICDAQLPQTALADLFNALNDDADAIVTWNIPPTYSTE